LSIIFPILTLSKSVVISLLGAQSYSWQVEKNVKMWVLGGIKYRQIHTYVIDWFSKIHHF
jgi:hypothetical protein